MWKTPLCAHCRWIMSQVQRSTSPFKMDSSCYCTCISCSECDLYELISCRFKTRVCEVNTNLLCMTCRLNRMSAASSFPLLLSGYLLHVKYFNTIQYNACSICHPPCDGLVLSSCCKACPQHTAAERVGRREPPSPLSPWKRNHEKTD